MPYTQTDRCQPFTAWHPPRALTGFFLTVPTGNGSILPIEFWSCDMHRAAFANERGDMMVATNGATSAPKSWDTHFTPNALLHVTGGKLCRSSRIEAAVGRVLWCAHAGALAPSLKQLGDLMQHTAIQLRIESESDIATLFEMRGHVEALHARACTTVTPKILEGLRLVESQWPHETVLKCCAESLRLSLSDLLGNLSLELQGFHSLATEIGDRFRRKPLSTEIRDKIQSQIGVAAESLFRDGHVVTTDYTEVAETFHQNVLVALERTKQKIAAECGPAGPQSAVLPKADTGL